MVKLRDLTKDLKSGYVSFTYEGKTVTYKKGMELNADVEVPKGAVVQINEGKGWKELKGGRK